MCCEDYYFPKGKFKSFDSLFHSVYLIFPKRLFSIADLFAVCYLWVVCNEDKCCVVTQRAADIRVAWLVYVRTYCVPIATLNQNRQTRLLYLGDVQITRRLRPCSHVHLFFKNENKFYSAVWPTFYPYPVKTLTEKASFSKTLSRKKIFENRRLIVYVWTYENRCFRYDDVIHHTQRTL